MSTQSFEVNESKAKEFAEKLTVAMRLRSRERMEEAAEAFVGLFEGENIIAVERFLNHVVEIIHSINSYYDQDKKITTSALCNSKEHKRKSRRDNSCNHPDQ